MKKIIGTFLMLCTSALLFSCGGGAASSTSTPPEDTSSRVYGVAVDPYIQGAQFCVDANLSGGYDAGEMLSSLSNASGVFYFDSAPPTGAMILMVQNGYHNGVANTIDLSAVYSPSGDFVISPTTTLNAGGLDASELAAMLQAAGVNVTAANVMTDPMDGLIGSGGDVSSEKLEVLRGSIVTAMLMKILDTAPYTPQQIHDDIVGGNVLGLRTLLTAIKDAVAGSLNTSFITPLTSQISTANSAIPSFLGLTLPAPTFSDIVKSASAVSDRLSAIAIANKTDGTYGMNAINTFLSGIGGTFNGGLTVIIGELGPKYYFARVLPSMSSSHITLLTTYAPSPYKEYASAANTCTSKEFYIDASGNSQCVH